MNEQDHTSNIGCGTADERTDAERTRHWTYCAISPGDSHDKGEQSLCVGEAA